jgi:site-specific DNA recombinase
MKAIGYVRRSKKSEARTISLQEQESQIRSFCARHELELVATISHDGISGTKRKRYDDLNKTLSETGARCLVVYHLDRLARDVSGLLDYIRGLGARGVSVFECGTGRVDLTKSTGFITTAVQGVFAELFPLIVGEKTRDALRRKREQGQRYTHVPPFGWRYEENKLVQDPDEQSAIKILDECRAAGLGARRTLRRLLATGYQGRRGVSTIHRALRFKGPVKPEHTQLPCQTPPDTS